MGTATRKATKRESMRQELAFNITSEARKRKLQLAAVWTRRGTNNASTYHRKASIGDKSVLQAGANAKHLRGVLFTI